MFPAQIYPVFGPHMPSGDVLPLGEGLDDACVPLPEDCSPGPLGDGVMLPKLIAVDIEIDDVSPPVPLPFASLTGRADSRTGVQFGIGIAWNTTMTDMPLRYNRAAPPLNSVLFQCSVPPWDTKVLWIVRTLSEIANG